MAVVEVVLVGGVLSGAKHLGEEPDEEDAERGHAHAYYADVDFD